MDVSRFVEAFRSLHINNARQHALDALLVELSPYEWRALHAATAARSFQFDIIGNLPTELVAAIFSYLETPLPYRMQLVSRQWYHVLRSLAVLTSSLNHWYHGAVDLQNANYALYLSKARRIDTFRKGKPHRHFPVHLRHGAIDALLTGDMLVWRPKLPSYHPRFIYVLNLSTWTLRTLTGEAREVVRSIAASDHIVALATFFNICYVWELHGQVSKKFKVPSQDYFNALTCRERTVACAARLEHHISVYIWDFDTQRGRSFQIDPGPSGFSFNSRRPCPVALALLLQPGTSSVVVFASHLCDCPDCHRSLQYGRFTYDGQCLESSNLPIGNGVKSLGLPSIERSFVPVDTQGRFAIKVMVDSTEPHGPPCMWLQYDEQLNKFIPIGHIHSPQGILIEQKTSWWKDTFYKFDLQGGSGSKMLVSNSSGYSKAFTIEGEAPDQFPLGWQTLMNESYVVTSMTDGFSIFCFDENDRHPKSPGDFFNIGWLKSVRGEGAVVIGETESSSSHQMSCEESSDVEFMPLIL